MISALQKHMISNDSLICKQLSVAGKKRTSHTKIICTQKSTESIIHKEYNEHISGNNRLEARVQRVGALGDVKG